MSRWRFQRERPVVQRGENSLASQSNEKSSFLGRELALLQVNDELGRGSDITVSARAASPAFGAG